MASGRSAICLLLFLCFAAGGFGNPVKQTKHPEIHRAKSEIDSLLFKLNLDLSTARTKATMAHQMQQEAETLIEIAEKEVSILGYIRHLLNRLSKGALDEKPWENCRFPQKAGITLKTGASRLPRNYTVSVTVNHRDLIDRFYALENGNDLKVFYNGAGKRAEPVQIDRVISGLGTMSAAVHFRLQAPIRSGSVDDVSYFLVFGGWDDGPALSNPAKVFAFYDDFTDNALKSDWQVNWGEWTVQNGMLRGKTGSTPTGDSAEIGVYVTSGSSWKDIQVELDMMDSSSEKAYPGPFLRVKNPSLASTTGWWWEYFQSETRFAMRPFKENRDGVWLHSANLPTKLDKNVWFHFKYQVLGDRFSHWANENQVQKNIQVSRQWMIPSGTIGLGCHRGNDCQAFYDNIKVTLLVSNPPTVSLGDMRPFWPVKEPKLLGQKDSPAHSCKQIHDASLLDGKPRVKNGLYWIKADNKRVVQIFCDMQNGGWTLAGKINGNVGNIHDTWLIKEHNTAELQNPKIGSSTQYACLDARALALEHASEILFSSGESEQGLGSKWVTWTLPDNRERDTFWKHAIGQATVNAAPRTTVTVKAWNGRTQTCYQNKYGIMPLQQHGGSYPSAAVNTNGNTEVNDLCMSVGVMASGTAHGWSQNANGYDSPLSDSDWPNQSYNHRRPRLSVWLK